MILLYGSENKDKGFEFDLTPFFDVSFASDNPLEGLNTKHILSQVLMG